MSPNPTTRFPMLFAEVPESRLEEVLALFVRRPIVPGEVLLREGQVVSHLLLIDSGRARVTAQVNGRTLDLGEVGPGAILGDVSLVDGRPASATVTVMVTGEMLRLAVAAFATLRGEDPALAALVLRGLCRSLSQRVRDATDRLDGIKTGRSGTTRATLVDTLRLLLFPRPS